ncbi:hypothetical protein L209DRAFT_162990 [Thermothelomyces heterothallicus CBS 203.75]
MKLELMAEVLNDWQAAPAWQEPQTAARLTGEKELSGLATVGLIPLLGNCLGISYAAATHVGSPY